MIDFIRYVFGVFFVSFVMIFLLMRFGVADLT